MFASGEDSGLRAIVTRALLNGRIASRLALSSGARTAQFLKAGKTAALSGIAAAIACRLYTLADAIASAGPDTEIIGIEGCGVKVREREDKPDSDNDNDSPEMCKLFSENIRPKGKYEMSDTRVCWYRCQMPPSDLPIKIREQSANFACAERSPWWELNPPKRPRFVGK